MKLYKSLGLAYQQLLNYDKSIEFSQRAIVLYEALENAIHNLQELRNHEDLGIAYIELATSRPPLAN